MQRILETERLQLMTLTKEAAPLVLAFYEENKDIFEPWEALRSNNFYTLSYQKAFLTAEYNQMAEGKLLRFWVFLKEQPEALIGTVCFQNFLKDPYHSCILGYKFSHLYHHQGYATESIQECMRLVFDEFNIHRMEAYIMPSNTPSLRLIERLSFRYEGFAYSYARIRGIWEDHLRYSYINPMDTVSL